LRVQVLLLLLLTAGSATTTAWAAVRAGTAAAKEPQARPRMQARPSANAPAKSAARPEAQAPPRKSAGGAVQKASAQPAPRKKTVAAKRRSASRRRAAPAKEPRFEPYVVQNWPEAALAAIPTVWMEIPPPPPLPDRCRVCQTWLLANAYQQIGIRYRLGGTRPDTGFDCSGLMKYLYETNFSITLPPTAPQQYQFGLRVEKWELEPGDLVFFRTRRGWHVGMYVGHDAFIHAPNRRKTVRVSPLFSDPYWRRAFVGARRVPVLVPGDSVLSDDLANNINN